MLVGGRPRPASEEDVSRNALEAGTRKRPTCGTRWARATATISRGLPRQRHIFEVYRASEMIRARSRKRSGRFLDYSIIW